jgi:ketosteroid isomerase-like protein
MKKIFLIVICILLFGACQKRYHKSNEMQPLLRWITIYEESIRKADIEQLLSFVSNAVVYLPSNQPSFSGKENLRKWYRDYFNYYTPSENLRCSQLEVKGDCAYLICDYSILAKENHSGKEVKDNGKLINIFKKQSNGEWEITYSIWNSNNQTFDLHSQIPADFSGTWKLDLSRSTDFPDLLSAIISIAQKGNELSIIRTYQIKNQEPITNSFNYIIGPEITTSTKSGVMKTTSSWSTDRQSFSITETLLSQNNSRKQEYKRTTTYSLTVKGEILNVNSNDILPQGILTATNSKYIDLVYNRQ